MTRKFLGLAVGSLLVVWSLAGCGSSEGEYEIIVEDGDSATEDYLTALTGNSRDGDYNGGVDGDAESGSPTEDDDEGKDDASREIAESDLYRVVGHTIYALNAYRGLAVIDFSDPSALRIIGRLRLEGEPKEMFVRDGIAVVFTTGLYESNGSQYRISSRVYSIDISVPAKPQILAKTEMEGTIFDDRMVGDVVYVLSTVYPWYDYCSGTNSNDRGSVEVLSLDISDAAKPVVADRLTLTNAGQAVYVSQNFLYVASAEYYYYDYTQSGSTIRIVDISDPKGAMRTRDSFEAAGWVQDRFKMNENGDVLAVVSNTTYWWNGDTVFETFDVANPDQPTRLAQTTIMQNESLKATRFDGDRAYVVTYRNTDPLFVVDYGNASNPVVLGDLVIPGWSTHLEIRGTKLYGMGVDDTDNWKVKVSLFDVSNPNAPAQLSTVSLGEGYSYSQANWDWKAFGLYDDHNLILVPTYEYASDWWSPPKYKLNLVTIAGDTLKKEGAVVSTSPVQRGFIAGDYLGSLSMTTLQVIDYADRMAPKVIGETLLATYVGDVVDCGRALCSVNDNWYDSTLSLRLFDPQTASDLPYWKGAALEGAGSYWGTNAKVIYDTPTAYVFSNRNSYYYGGYEDAMAADSTSDEQAKDRLYAYDLSDPKAPVLKGSAPLIRRTPNDQSPNGYYYYYDWSFADRLTDSKVLAGMRAGYFYDDDLGRYVYNRRFVAYDLSRIDENVAPELPDLALSNDDALNQLGLWNTKLLIRGSKVWLPTCEAVKIAGDERPYARCFATAVDTATPASPKIAAKINVPGQLVNVSEDETLLTTVDRQFTGSREEHYNYGYGYGYDYYYIYYSCSYTLNLLKVEDGHARRLLSKELYKSDYCYSEYRQEENGGDNDTSYPGDEDVTPSVDGDSSTPSEDDTAPSVDGDYDKKMAVTTLEPFKAMKKEVRLPVEKKKLIAMDSTTEATEDGDSDTTTTYSYTYANVLFEGERIYVVNTYYSYSYDNGGSCGSNYTETHGIELTILNGKTGQEIKTISLPDAYTVVTVQGGGLVASGYTYSPTGNSVKAIYISQDGETKALDLPGTNYYYYYWLASSPLRKGDTLYLPLGWEGIFKTTF